MHRTPGGFVAVVSSAVLVTTALAGCSRSGSDQKNVPTAEVKTQQPTEAVNKPVTSLRLHAGR